MLSVSSRWQRESHDSHRCRGFLPFSSWQSGWWHTYKTKYRVKLLRTSRKYSKKKKGMKKSNSCLGQDSRRNFAVQCMRMHRTKFQPQTSHHLSSFSFFRSNLNRHTNQSIKQGLIQILKTTQKSSSDRPRSIIIIISYLPHHGMHAGRPIHGLTWILQIHVKK